MTVAKPVVKVVSYSDHSSRELEQIAARELGGAHSEPAQYILDYPTVYVVTDENNELYRVYVGETSDIRSRTNQHLTIDPETRDDWLEFKRADNPEMYVIGHELFNKSLTLDIENRLMAYLTASPSVVRVENRRGNPQKQYHTKQYFDDVFDSIWQALRTENERLFPSAEVVRDSALFKASPFHALNVEQEEARSSILNAIEEALGTDTDEHQLILVSGLAGTGKTVLLSSILYELFQNRADPETPDLYRTISPYLLVNNPEQVKVYDSIAKKLGLTVNGKTQVSRPTTFINNTNRNDPADVVLIDEGHLLWTQGKQSYKGDNQLFDIIERSRVTVLVFDPYQVMAGNQYWEPHKLEQMMERADAHIELKMQMRISGNEETQEWIQRITRDQIIGPIPRDPAYDLRIYDDVGAMYEDIRKRASATEQGLSRLLATFDWDYNARRPDADGRPWTVKVGDFELPWNRETTKALKLDRHTKRLAWAEQAATINEVGSHFTVQGFDLNVAAVILGPSIKYRDGRIQFDASESKNRAVTNRRSLDDGTKLDVSLDLLRNEMNVLLTRGVNGLYIYAVDPQLREALLKASQEG